MNDDPNQGAPAMDGAAGAAPTLQELQIKMSGLKKQFDDAVKAGRTREAVLLRSNMDALQKEIDSQSNSGYEEASPPANTTTSN